MGAILTKFCLGQTDVNENGIPDNKEIIKLIQSKIDKALEKKNKKILKRFLK